MVSDKKAYKAMKKIRKYCSQQQHCTDTCIFKLNKVDCKIIDEQMFPANWKDIETMELKENKNES